MLRKLWRLVPYIARQWPALLAVLSMSCVTALVTVLHPWPLKVLVDYGYAGFELHTGRSPEVEVAYPTYTDEIEAYAAFRRDLDSSGLGHVQLATNVGATPALDPSSDDPSVRRAAGAFLRSRADIAAALRAEILMGPVVIPYAGFVHSAPNADPVWSDALQDQLSQRYENAAPVLDEVGEHARRRGVKIAIENVWNNFILSPLEANRYLDEIASEWVGWHLDLGNLLIYGWPEQWARILGPRVLQLHIKEYSRKKLDDDGRWDGFGVELGDGDNDWPAIMRALDDIGYDGWAIAEVGGGDAARLKDVSARMDRCFA